MVLEIADFAIRPGHEDAFAAAYREAVVHIERAPGFRSVRMTRGIESPARFVLLVEWDSVADHQAFRDSEDFPRWRAPITEHLDGTPRVEHLADV